MRRYNKEAPILPCLHVPKYLQAVNGNVQHDLSWIKGKNVAALSGIAAPKLFEQFLIDSGAKIVYKEHFLDHHAYTQDDIEEFFLHAKDFGADICITTEKDAVRIQGEVFPLPFFFLRMEIEWVKGTQPFEVILEKLANLKS